MDEGKVQQVGLLALMWLIQQLLTIVSGMSSRQPFMPTLLWPGSPTRAHTCAISPC